MERIFQDYGISQGEINDSIVEPIKKPYFYSIFKLINTNKTFNLLTEEELSTSYRYCALNKVLVKINKNNESKHKIKFINYPIINSHRRYICQTLLAK